MRITVERTRDIGLINRIMRHPAIYDAISDDTCPPAEQFDATPAVVDGARFIFLAPHDDDGNVAGVWMFEKKVDGTSYEVHTCILPEYRGRFAKSAAMLAMKWIFENTRARSITTRVPRCNRTALVFAKWCGMVPLLLEREAFVKNGVPHDVNLLAINRSRWEKEFKE
jgi:RimJ/RimL family protein N-acetyltransferase